MPDQCAYRGAVVRRRGTTSAVSWLVHGICCAAETVDVYVQNAVPDVTTA